MAKKKTSIKVEGVSISKEFVASHKSEADFIKTMEQKTYDHLFEGDSRQAKLKEVYSLAVPKKEAPAKG